MRTILISNESSVLSDQQVGDALLALEIQLNRDFAPRWGASALLQFVAGKPDPGVEAIHVLDDSDQANALGYHLLDQADVPEGFVFARTSGDGWPTTLSHELLEQLVDPWVYLTALVPSWQGSPAALALEVCDPVEGDTYDVNGFALSNFILPLWFTPGPLPSGSPALVDFLGRLSDPLSLTPGGYQAYTRDLVNWQDSFARRALLLQRYALRHSRHQRRRRSARGRTLVLEAQGTPDQKKKNGLEKQYCAPV